VNDHSILYTPFPIDGTLEPHWLAYADHICILADSKTELSVILNAFNDVMTKYGKTLSAEKTVTMWCWVCLYDTSKECSGDLLWNTGQLWYRFVTKLASVGC